MFNSSCNNVAVSFITVKNSSTGVVFTAIPPIFHFFSYFIEVYQDVQVRKKVSVFFIITRYAQQKKKASIMPTFYIVNTISILLNVYLAYFTYFACLAASIA